MQYVDSLENQAGNKPALRKLTLEQAKLILLGHATLGNEDAKSLLEVIFAELPRSPFPREG